jgi:Na+-transporting NADH:ubiquinone oxidoreductase subunit A
LNSDLTTVGILGGDFPGVKPALKVSKGDSVSAGDVLFHDKRDSQICAFAPVSGQVLQIHRGPGRTLTSIAIAQEGLIEQGIPYVNHAVPEDRDVLISVLLVTGLWTRLRQRPFGTVPRTSIRPRKLFVTALESRPGAADPISLVQAELAAFKLGLEAFCLLPTEETILCLRQPLPLLPIKKGLLRQMTFPGKHPNGLPGTHVHLLSNPTPDNPVLVVDARTVVELGQLLSGVSATADRTVEVSGEGLSRPGIYTAVQGASIGKLLEQAGGSVDLPNIRVIAGSALDGRQVSLNNAFLGVFEHQLQVLNETPLRGSRGLRGLPVFDRTGFLARIGLRDIFARTGTHMNGAIASMVPAESMERVWPHRVPVIPLLRALVTEDDDTALDLGALAFVEEDMSLVSWACPGKYDYGQALRAFLDRIQLDMS